MTLENLATHLTNFIKLVPESQDEFISYYELAASEIEEGGSPEHECMLAYNDMLETAKQTITNK